MLTDRDRLRIHVQTLFTQNQRGDLLRVNEVNGERAPRFFLGRTADGKATWFREDLSEKLRQDLEAAVDMVPSGMGMLPPPGGAPFEAILGAESPLQNVWTGPAFRFDDVSAHSSPSVRITDANASVLSPHLASWCEDVSRHQPMYAVLQDGHAVTVCGSVRRTALAHEAGVETAEAFRGKGYAVQVVRGWAAAVKQLGCLPLYSTSWTNLASRALARRLRLVQYASDLHIT